MLVWHVFSFYPKAISGWWPDRKAGSVERWLKMRASCGGSTSGRILNKSVWGSMGKGKFRAQSSCISCLTSSVCTDPYSWSRQNNWGWTLVLTHDTKTCLWSDGVKDSAACLPASSLLQGLCIKEVRGCTDTEFCDVVAMLLGMKASRGCRTGTRNKAWAFLSLCFSSIILTGHRS